MPKTPSYGVTPDLALLVYREHQGVRRRGDVEVDDIAQLGSEVRVVGQLELVRLGPTRPIVLVFDGPSEHGWWTAPGWVIVLA